MYIDFLKRQSMFLFFYFHMNIYVDTVYSECECVLVKHLPAGLAGFVFICSRERLC